MVNNLSLKLYVVSDTAVSKESIANIKKFLDEEKIDYSLKIVDVLSCPEETVNAGVVATPTLIKELPLPEKKIIGAIKDKKKLLDDLEI